MSLLTYVVAELDGAERVSIPHSRFAGLFSPDRGTNSGKRQVARAIKSLEFDMAATGFSAVIIKRGYIDKSNPGEEKPVDTEYVLNEARAVIEKIQRLSIQCDLFALPPRKRTKRLELIIRDVLTERGYEPVTVKARDEQRKVERREKSKQTLADRDAENVRRMPLKDRIHHFLDEVYAAGKSLIEECGEYDEARYIVSKLYKVTESLDAGALSDKRKAIAKFNNPN